MPLGTLDMAWAEPRQVPGTHWTPLPERHLPFAHMVEQLVQDVIRQFRERAEYLTEAALGRGDEEPVSLEEVWGADTERRMQEHRAFEDQLVTAIAEDEGIDELAGSALHATEIEEPASEIIRLPIDGDEVACVDIREASRQLNCPMNTLRGRHERGDIPFVWHEGRRYLPVEELPAAEVVVRKMKQWEEMLGVSRRTVHRWMADLPDDLAPLEMEARLLERAGRKPR